MDYIHSKDIFLLTRETLKFVDRRIMDHGSRVAYYVYCMLRCRGGYELYELADISMICNFHDIGVYQTDKWDNMPQIEMKDYMPHSVYGYLFMKNLSSLEELSKVILYHHMDYRQLKDANYKYKIVAECINVAETAELFFKNAGNRIDCARIERQSGSKFSPEAVALLYRAMEEYDLQGKLICGEYKEELDKLAEFLIFSNQDKEQYLRMLMYCEGFRSPGLVVDVATGIGIAEGLAAQMKITQQERKNLYYATMLHDIGMLAIPREITDAPRALTGEETRIIRRHIAYGNKVLANRMKPQVVEIINAHHERCDASGYPRGLRGEQMNQLQKALQLVDTITGLHNRRPYREPVPKQEIMNIITRETILNRYDRKIAMLFIENYDKIMDVAALNATQIMATYKKLNQQYLQAMGNVAK